MPGFCIHLSVKLLRLQQEAFKNHIVAVAWSKNPLLP